jgi:hypothetical protein
MGGGRLSLASALIETYAQEQKKIMVETCQASGLITQRFATLHGVNDQTLISWIKKRRFLRHDRGHIKTNFG